MRIFKPSYTTATNETRKTSRWYVEVRVDEARVRVPGFIDRGATTELGRQLQRLAALRAVGERPDAALSRAIEHWPSGLRARVARVGLLTLSHAAGLRPLSELLSEFEAHLRSRDRSAKHVDHVVERAKRIIAGCGFRSWSDISGPAVERYLRALREDKPGKEEGEKVRGLSAKSSNHLLASLRQFCRWAVETGLASEDPLRSTKPLNARVDPRRERRALSFHDELPRLIRAAAGGPEYRGVSGPLRALTYKLLSESGLRVAELAALRVRDFDGLGGERPTVTVQAATAKNRCERTLPLRQETAREVATFLAGRLPQARALALPLSFKDKGTRWLRFDLERAGIDYEDESGRVADLHALRASMVSGLVRAGADARTVQALARHSTADLTLSVYAKLGRDSERDALALLPSLPSIGPSRDCVEATGTDGELGPQLVQPAAEQCSTVPLHATSNTAHDLEMAAACAGSDEFGGGGGSRTRVPGVERVRLKFAPAQGLTPNPLGEAGGGLGPQLVPSAGADPALAALVDRWPSLTAEQRAAVVRVAGLSALTHNDKRSDP